MCVRVACVTEGGLVGTCSRLSFSVPASRRVAADSELASPEPPSLPATCGRVPGRPASKGSRHPSDRHPGLVRAAAERRLVGVTPLTHQTRRPSRRRLPLNEADSTRAFFFFPEYTTRPSCARKRERACQLCTWERFYRHPQNALKCETRLNRACKGPGFRPSSRTGAAERRLVRPRLPRTCPQVTGEAPGVWVWGSQINSS